MALTPEEIDAIEVQTPTAPKRLTPEEIDALPEPAISPVLRREPPADLSRVRSSEEPIPITTDLKLAPQGVARSTIAPDRRNAVQRAFENVTLTPRTLENPEGTTAKAFPRLVAADIAAGNLETLLPGVDPDTGQSERSQFPASAPAPTWAKVTAGAQHAVAGTAEAIVPFILGGQVTTATRLPLLARGVSAYFAQDMLRAIPPAARTFIEAVEAGDVQTATETGVSIPLSVFFSYQAAKHAVGRTRVPQFDVNGEPLIDPKTGKPIEKPMGLAEESPAVRWLLTRKIASEYSPEQIREVFMRVNRGEANPAEQELVRFINQSFEAPGKAVRQGVKLTSEQPVMESEFWQDWLGLKKGQTTIELLKPTKAKPLSKEEIDNIEPLGGPNAAQDVQQSGRVPKQLVGVDAERQKIETPSPRDRVPRPAGQPQEVVVEETAEALSTLTPEQFRQWATGKDQRAIQQRMAASVPPSELTRALSVAQAEAEAARAAALSNANEQTLQAAIDTAKKVQFFSETLGFVNQGAGTTTGAVPTTQKVGEQTPPPSPEPAELKGGAEVEKEVQRKGQKEDVTPAGEKPPPSFELAELVKADVKADPRLDEPGITRVAKPNRLIVQFRDLQSRPVSEIELRTTGDPVLDAKAFAVALGSRAGDNRISRRESMAVSTGPNGRAIYHFGMSPNGVAWTTAQQLVDARKQSKAPEVKPEPPKQLPAPKSSIRKGTKAPAGETKPVKPETNQPLGDPLLTLSQMDTISNRLKVADGMGVKMAGIRSWLEDVQSGDPKRQANQPDFKNTLDAINLAIANAQREAKSKADFEARNKPAAPKAATDANLTAMSDADFDALLEEASKPEEAPVTKTEAISQPKPQQTGAVRKPTEKVNQPKSSIRKPQKKLPSDIAMERIAEEDRLEREREAKAKAPSEHATDAAKAIKAALDEAAAGLDELFGGGTHMGSGPSFNEETYKKAKPHFDKAWENAKKGGGSILDFLKEIIKRWGEAVKPYLKRWRDDLAKGQTNVDESSKGKGGSGGAGGEQPAITGETGKGKTPAPAAKAESESVQPPIRPPDEGTKPNTGRGGSGGADADVDRVPGESGPTTTDTSTVKGGGGTTGGIRSGAKNIRLEQNPAPTGAVARIEANVAAIRIVKKLEAENRQPTEEERQKIAKWSGWGSFKEMFNEGRAQKRDWDVTWMKRYGRFFDTLKTLLTTDEFNAAAESSVNAHYTSKEAVDAIWTLAKRLGYQGGRALEPSTGSGVFIGYMPEELAASTHWTGVEMEPITGKIFSYLYPEADTRIQGFEKAKLPNGFYDLAITNVPFHEVGPGAEYPDLNLHNYFIARMLDKVRPGGLVMVITTHNTMDARPEQRKFLAEKGQLVGAIRLPNNAFKESAATEVVTDIIVLRKSDGKPFNAAKWDNTTKVSTDEGMTEINEFFANNPDMVLGRNALTGTMYKKDSYTVEGTGDLGLKLARAIESFPKDILDATAGEQQAKVTKLEEGTLLLNDKGHVMEARNFQLQAPTSFDPSSVPLVRRAKLYIAARDVLRRQYDLEDDPKATDEQIETNRKALKAAYDRLRKEVGGPLNFSERRLGHLSNDPDYYTLMGLEVVREVVDPADETKTITKAEPSDVLSKRVRQPDRPPEKADNPAEALAVSLSFKGEADIGFMAQLTGLTQEQVEAELIQLGMGFKDPETGRFVEQSEYLTGDVRDKYAKAIFAAKDNQEFEPNVTALKKVIPSDVPFERIKYALSSRWIPPVVLNTFSRQIVGLSGDEISFVPVVEEFSVKMPKQWNRKLARGKLIEFSTEEYSAEHLLHMALNFKRARIMKEVEKGKYREDVERSAVNNQIIDKLIGAFEEWSRTAKDRVDYRYFDSERGEYVSGNLAIWDAMQREYNRTKNSFVIPEHDGTKLKLPGLSETVRRTPHLLSGVIRAITAGNAVFGHGVGSGKTFLAIVAMHELQRLGLMRKGVMVVKKPTVDQYRVSINRAYPGSRVLIPSKADFEPSNRKKLAARIASGRWDFIVLTHEQFKAVRTSEESINDFYNDQLNQLRQILKDMGEADAEDAKSTRGMDPAVRNIVKKLKSLKKRMDAHITQAKKHQDIGLEWQHLGVDGVWVDESHNFKKMPIPTQMENIRGIPSDFSQRAVDLMIKIRDIQRRTEGRNVFFASGTPVSNTLAELWVMFHATAPKLTKQFGVETFDSFASAYATAETNFELGWDNNFHDVTRMARFKNGASLTMLTRMGMDVKIGNKELGLDVPDLAGGKPQIIITKPNPAFQRWIDLLSKVSEEWDTLDAKGRFEWSWIPITAMRAGVAAALDPRLVFPNAEDHPDSKVNVAVGNIFDAWQSGKEKRTTMMVFADMYRTLNTSKLLSFIGGETQSRPTDESEIESEAETEQAASESDAYLKNAVGTFNLYEDIKAKLVARGVPESEVAIITDHDTDVKRDLLFNKVRAGAVRVLIGSTEKIGEGVDVPQRMSHQFHLDPPMQMTPAKMEQRIGRIIRQGNLHSPKNWNTPVHIQLYAQERSMDAPIYGMLETKAVMVLQALKGQYLGDEFDDPASELTMAMAEMRAAATGDTRVLRLAQLKKEVRDLNIEYGSFLRRRSELSSNAERNADLAKDYRKSAENFDVIAKAVEESTADKDKTVLTHEGQRVVGEKQIETLLEAIHPTLDAALDKEKEVETTMRIGKVNVRAFGRVNIYNKNKEYSLTTYTGPLNYDSPRWDSDVSSVESLPRVLAALPKNARERAERNRKQAGDYENLASDYAEQLTRVKFEKNDLRQQRNAELEQLEGELRHVKASKKPTVMDLMLKEAGVQLQPLHNRLKIALARAESDLEAANEDMDKSEQSRLEDRIADLRKRIGVVEQARIDRPSDELPEGRTQSKREGVSYDVETKPFEAVGESGIVLPPVEAMGMEKIRQMVADPANGLSDEARRIALAFFDTPAAKDLDWSNLVVRLFSRTNEPYGGSASVSNDLMVISRTAKSQTIPHEFFHFLYEMLPSEYRQALDDARHEAIDRALAVPDEPGEIMALLDELKKRTLTSAEFRVRLESVRAQYGDEEADFFRNEFYALINPGEFLSEFAGRKFSDDQWNSRNRTRFQKLWDKLKEWMRSLVDAIKRAVGMKPDVEQVYRELLAGRHKRRSAPTTDEIAESPEVPTKAEREAVIEEGVADKRVPTQVMGETDYVRGREQITPLSTQEALVHARNVFNEAGLTVEPDMAVGGWRLVNTGVDQSAEGRQLVEILRREIATKNAPGKAGDLLASLLNSVVLNFKAGTMQFDQPTREALYELAQSDRSQRGLALGALAGFRDDLSFVGRNVDVVLNRVYADRWGGSQIGGLLERVIRNFRAFFTDKEIEDALKSKENAEAMIGQIIALNRRDEGGKVYRRVQSLLKPKNEKKTATLEADARVEEAVNEILRQAEQMGITPVPSPNQPLPALRRLLLMVSEKNAAKIDKLIANAVAEAERNAGIAATLKSAADDEQRAEFEQQFAEGAAPDADMIEEGLSLPQFSHWKEIRDNLLGYSPVTLKLVSDLIREDFKGTIKQRSARQTVDARIDLNKLAVEPEAEVRRVLDAYLELVQNNMDLARAPIETVQRISEAIERELILQLEAVRKKYRDPLFTEPKKGQAITVEEHLRRQINAGLFQDARLVREMVQRVAGKSTLQRLTPSVTALVKRVFDTPIFRQNDLKHEFARRLVADFGVSEEQATKASEVFASAFAQKFATAKASAFKQAREAITPKEPALVAMKKSVWRRIEQAVNAGVFDTGTVLREIAAANGWTPPTDQLVAQMRQWTEEEQRLRELTPTEQARYTTPEKLAAAQREKEAATMERRVQLKKKMEVEWAKMTRPISAPWEASFWSNRRNFAAAGNELVSANMLLKLGFAPKQVLSVLTQGAIHTPTRAIAHAIEAWQMDRAKGRESNLWQGVNQALKDSYKARFASIQSALYATRAAFLGRGEARNVDRLMSGIASVERLSRQADIYEERGDHGRAGVMRLLSLIRLGYRVAQALDNVHGLPAEYQEMVLQVERGLRELGKSRAEIEMAKDQVIGDMQAEWVKAIDHARMWYDSNGLTPKKAELEESAWNIVKRWQYDRIRELGLPADDFEEQNRILRSTIGWNERETKGLGGAIGRTVTFAGQMGEAVGIPLAIGRFGNAIAISINRQLAFTPFAFLADVGAGESGWTRTSTDRTQRKIEMGLGSIVGAALLALAWLGVLIVRTRWPKDPEERDLWEAQGIRPGTVEIHLGNGEFIPFSLNTGPFQPVATYLAAGGALYDLSVDRKKKQARLEEDALKTGLPAGKIKPVSIGDMMAVAGAAAQSSIMGGRTAAGLVSSVTDYGLPNSQKMLASQVAPLIPGLPAMQEISRMAGVNLDARMASFWDFLLPLPSSGARKVNLLGEPAGTPNDLQRIIQVLTGGTYPGVVDPKEAQTRTAYEALFASGYRPPSIDPNKGFAVGGDFRPLTNQELSDYTALRGRYFAEELAAVGATEDPKAARVAYQRANARALADVGVSNVRLPSAAPAPAPRAELSPVGIPNAPAPARSPRGPSIRTGRTRRLRSGRRTRSTFGRGPSLRVGRGLRVPRAKTRRLRRPSIRKRPAGI